MSDNRLICSEDKKRAIREAKLKTKSRRASQVVRTFECKLKTFKLNARQREELEKIFVEAKWFYNYVLNIRKERECSLNSISSTGIKSVIHFDKDRCEVESELELLSSQQKQKIISNMISNEKTIKSLVKNGYQKHGSLKFKSEVNCIPLKQFKNTYDFKSFHKVKIAGLSGKLYVNGTQQFLGIPGVEIANANLVRKANGYFLYVTTFWNKNIIQQVKKNGKRVGIDFGCQTNLTFSDGSKTNVQVEETERLKKFQKRASRQKMRSSNWHKSYSIVRREYQKITNRKQDLANKIVHRMKAYEKVVIQDEQLANWKRNKHGKRVHHSCMGTIKSKLKMLDNVVVLDKFIPTTKWCPCGFVNEDITEHDRFLTCPNCGKAEDRDVHSAKNMLAIYDLVISRNIVPRGTREVKLVDFRAATAVVAKDDERQAQEDEARRC